ncbi:NHL repeat domain-containing protein [Ditylenchus destructor]|nr:NHL repeat domain-containing protein [Ditylenchus destructor]
MSSDPCANLDIPTVSSQDNKQKCNNGVIANPLEKIEQLLTCSICLERYRSPKLLPCQHTFCLPCLDNYADVSLRTLKCPECRAEHFIDPYEGMKTLPTNLTLAAFLEIHLEASDENSEQLQAYIQRYNLERCRVCDEKAELEFCPHCEKKTCSECRKIHIEALKRDLQRLLNQVRRLSNRVKEASDGLGKGLDSLTLNGENTKAEIKEYFHRYNRELKRREEHFLNEAETFVETESRLMRALRDVVNTEYNNLQDGCIWVDAVLSGTRSAKDEELSRIKNVFVQGLEYLRTFQPDSDDLFAKKLRFSPGDDASKLPIAISNFGELTVSLPQFSNRYMPMEEQYLPRPFRMPLESDFHKASKSGEDDSYSSRFNNRGDDDIISQRYKRRQQLEDDARNRLKPVAPSGAISPNGSSRCNSPLTTNPWSKPMVRTGNKPDTTEIKEIRAEAHASSAASSAAAEKPAAESSQKPTGAAKPAQESAQLKKTEAKTNSSKSAEESLKTENAPANSKKPPLPRQGSSQDDKSLNEKITKIRKAHERRQQEQGGSSSTREVEEEEEADDAAQDQEGHAPRQATRRFKIIHHRSVSSGRNATKSPQGKATSEEVSFCSIPIAHYPGQRQLFSRSKTSPDIGGRNAALAAASFLNQPYSLENSTIPKMAQVGRRDSVGEANESAMNTTTSTSATDDQADEESGGNRESRSGISHASGTHTNAGISKDVRRSRFRRRSSIVPDREFSTEEESESPATQRAQTPTPYIDYASKQRPRLVIGRRGTLEGEMHWPRGLCYMPGGEVAVCDSSNNRVQIFDTSDGRLIRTFGKYGSKAGELDSPAGIAYNRHRQQIIVSDRYNHRVQIFDLSGKFVRQFGSRGSDRGQFNNPWGVAIDNLGLIYVVDKDNHRVQVFDQNGTFMSKFGSLGEGTGQFNHPLFITIHKRDQNLIISDSANHRICVFNHDCSPLFIFGTEGFSAGQLKLPRGVAVDDQGFIIVADSGNNRIQVFSPDGKSVIKMFGAWGSAPAQLKGKNALFRIFSMSGDIKFYY